MVSAELGVFLKRKLQSEDNRRCEPLRGLRPTAHAVETSDIDRGDPTAAKEQGPCGKTLLLKIEDRSLTRRNRPAARSHPNPPEPAAFAKSP